MALIIGTAFADVLLGTADGDTIEGLDGGDNIAGRDGNDDIKGGGGSDLLLGNQGDDTLDGGTGQDRLLGGVGNDSLSGGAGADWLSGDEGADTLRGGNGADTFFFNARSAGVDGSDTIADFNFGAGDKLSFGKYDGKADSLVFVQNGANVEVYVDLGTDATSDYLAVTVLNASAADVESASSFLI